MEAQEEDKHEHDIILRCVYLEHENDTHVIVMEGQMEMGEDEERNLEVNEVMDKVEDFEKEMFFFVGLLY